MSDDSSWATWADVLGSAVGGGLLAGAVWLLGSGPCPDYPAQGLTMDCVTVRGVQYGMDDVALWVPLAALVLGFFIHWVRETG